MKILFIGDIVGKPGRKAVRVKLPMLLADNLIDCAIANAENAAGGFGLTPSIVEELHKESIDIITSGNHIWDKKKEIFEILEEKNCTLRPANYPEGVAGRGSALYRTKKGSLVGVINILGRVFMDDLDCPFKIVLQEIEKLREKTQTIIVDMHAEATSEKQALGWFLDGRVSAVIGTHTHVQTADERILPQGTGYITDAGMSGSLDSVIGMKKEIAIQKFLTQISQRFEVAKNDVHLQGVILSVDDKSGKCDDITRFNLAV